MPTAQCSTCLASGQIVFAVSCRHLRDADDRFRICVDLLQAQLRLQSIGVHRHVLEEAAKQARVLPRLKGGARNAFWPDCESSQRLSKASYRGCSWKISSLHFMT